MRRKNDGEKLSRESEVSIEAEAKREENAKAIGVMLEKLGVGRTPDKAKSELYSGKWKTLTGFELEEDVPKQIVLPEDDRPSTSLFCAKIERKNLRICLIIIKANLCPESTVYADKEESHGMG